MAFLQLGVEFVIVGKSGLRYLEIFEFVAPNDLLKLVLCIEKTSSYFTFGGSYFVWSRVVRFDSGDEFGFLFILRSREYVVVRWQCFEKKIHAAKKGKKTMKIGQNI